MTDLIEAAVQAYRAQLEAEIDMERKFRTKRPSLDAYEKAMVTHAAAVDTLSRAESNIRVALREEAKAA